jgi:hypothetical protein
MAQALKSAQKSSARTGLINLITEAITHDDIFTTINYRNKSEDEIKQFIYPHLLSQLIDRELALKPKTSREAAKARLKKSLKWEGNVKTTVHHILFMGTQNRPDMVLEAGGLKIAIEFKRGDKGSDLRAGIGQCLIYSTAYDFIVYLFVDTSRDKRIRNAQSGEREAAFTQMMWDRFNTRFAVV